MGNPELKEVKKVKSSEINYSGVVGIPELIERVNQEAADLFYISEAIHLPEKSEIKRCYWTDFRLVAKNEIKKLCKENKKLAVPEHIKSYGFFVYNERKNIVLPFKKNDYLMDDTGYTTFDGEVYHYYDNNGIELGTF